MKIIRLIFIILVVALLIGSLSWLAMQKGQIAYTGGSVDITTSPVVAASALLLVAILLTAIIGLVGWLISLPNKIKKASVENNRKKAIDSIGLAIAASENGDFVDAKKHAAKSLSLLPDAAVAKLLHAKFALMNDDVALAEKQFGELSEVSGFESAARKGLAEIANKKGNFSAAISHADAAMAASKRASWPVEMMFKQRIENADWDGALDAIDEAEKRGLVGKLTAQRRRAVVLTAEAHKAEKAQDINKALDLANRAVKASPSFAPAAVMCARLNHISGKDWNAASIIEQAWAKEPHPALALAYRDLKEGASPEETSKWLDALARMNPQNRESKILIAEDYIARKDSQRAISILNELLEEGQTSRLYELKAKALMVLGDANGYNETLAKAASSPREEDWSDLDPEGSAFAYEDKDWARLAITYGDEGALIHPRHENAQPSKAIIETSKKETSLMPARPQTIAKPTNGEVVKAPSADDPGGPLDYEEGPKNNWY